MGFDLSRPVFKLVFDMPAYSGLEVRARAAGVEELATIAGLADEPSVASALRLIDAFGSVLVDWNIEQDGEPVPATVDGLRRLDYPSLMVIVRAWLEAVAGLIPAAAPDPIDESELPMDLPA